MSNFGGFKIQRETLPDITLTGTKEEISSALALLQVRGCFWLSDRRFHPIDGQPDKFDYYLTNVTISKRVPS